MPYASLSALRAYQTKWVQARRAKWISDKGPCALCGGDKDLEVDHTDPAAKEIPVARVWSMSETNPRRVAELAKCRVLCAECHLAKSNTEKAKGADNGQAKLTPEQAREIRESTESWHKIGQHFPVGKSQFYRVRRGEDYSFV